jgi:glycosyltransferase involved in cell wall biosynthesis
MGADERPSALMLAPEAPYPLAGGGALRTASLVHYLARTHELDLIVFRQPGAPDPAKALPPSLVRKVWVLDLPAHRRGSLARAARNAVRLAREVPPLVDRFSGFERQLEEIAAGARYDIGVVEHFWCAPYVAQLSEACRVTVLDLHNVESVLHARCAAACGGVAGFAHGVFGRAALELEREWLPRFTRVLAASEEDACALRAIAPGICAAVYPNAIPFAPLPPRGNDDAIVFSGNMEYHPNVSAVGFFRAEVWPLLRERWPGLVWRLIGRNPQAVARYTAGDPRIEVAGPVEDAVRELARAKVAVVPLLAGSGTRFKILEAWAAGLPVVSTTIGAEGLPARDGVNLLLADTGPRFAEAVSRLLESAALREKLGMSGRLLVENDFTWDAAWRTLQFPTAVGDTGPL